MAKPKRISPKRDVPILNLAIEQRPIASLKPCSRNARTHSDKQKHQIAASFSEFGVVNPLLVGPDGEIIAGHGRLEAAKLLGLVDVPVIVLSHLSDGQKRALRIADNKLALNAGWDLEILKLEIIELADLELDFDLEITGFETAELDLIIEGSSAQPKIDPADAMPPACAKAISRLGDLWLTDKHRLLCGNALNSASFMVLMGKAKARLVFSDPPYNVKIDGHVCGAGSVKHREFAMASGEMSRDEFIAFLTAVFRNLAEVSLDGAVHYQCMDWRHMTEMLRAGEAAYSKLLNMCVWAKNNGGMGSFYRSRHELVFVWKVGTEPHLNTIELGKHGRYRTNVWDYAGVNTLKPGRMEELAMHPTVKPVALVSDAIKDASRRGDVVLDCFGGSGTTLIAAEKTGRKARLMELDPVYCDVIVRRWQRLTGKTATLAETGQSFDEVAAERTEAAEGDQLEEGGVMGSKEAPKKDTRFKKGQSGNPNGRPKKKPVTIASTLQKIAQEKLPSSDVTMLEAYFRSLWVRSLQRDNPAANTLARLFKEAGLFVQPDSSSTPCHPVLLVPASIDPDEWEKAVAEQQAKYRCNTGEDDD